MFKQFFLFLTVLLLTTGCSQTETPVASPSAAPTSAPTAVATATPEASATPAATASPAAEGAIPMESKTAPNGASVSVPDVGRSGKKVETPWKFMSEQGHKNPEEDYAYRLQRDSYQYKIEFNVRHFKDKSPEAWLEWAGSKKEGVEALEHPGTVGAFRTVKDDKFNKAKVMVFRAASKTRGYGLDFSTKDEDFPQWFKDLADEMIGSLKVDS